MTEYLPMYSQSVALDRSAAVATFLGCARDPDDVTLYWFPVIVHPQGGGAAALAVRDSEINLLTTDEQADLLTWAELQVTPPPPPPPPQVVPLVIYAAPDGDDTASGEQDGPWTLTHAVDKALDDGSVIVLDGVHTVPASTTLGGNGLRVTVEPAPGAHPVVTSAEGTPPRVVAGVDMLLRGLSFVGTKQTSDNPVQMGDGAVIEDCTFSGYYGCVSEGGHIQCVYRRCRFINCGTGSFYHSIYISNFNAQPGEGAIVEDCIFIGGEGYHLHLWHKPQYVTIRRCFSGDADYCTTADGIGHVIENNVWWRPSSPFAPVNLAQGTAEYRHNFHGPITGPIVLNGHQDWFGSWDFPPNIVASENVYMVRSENDWDAPQVALGQEAAHLGATATQLDGAIAALKAAYLQAPAAIHSDATIETNFALLAGVVDTWAN